MARPTDGPIARTERITIRFTELEVAALDKVRGTVSRAAFIRKLIIREYRRGFLRGGDDDGQA